MKDFYCTYRGKSASTATLEAFLIRKTGAVPLVGAFHRFVYGFEDQTSELRLHAEIIDAYGVRPARKGSINVRVHNAGPTLCRHFVVVITDAHAGGLPIAAAALFDLAAGRSRTVTLRFPRMLDSDLPPRLDATVYAREGRRSRRPCADPAVQVGRRPKLSSSHKGREKLELPAGLNRIALAQVRLDQRRLRGLP